MVRGCENLRGTIKRNLKYWDPGQLSLPPDPSTGQLPQMILQVPDHPDQNTRHSASGSRPDRGRQRSEVWHSVTHHQEVESTPGGVGILERRMSEVKARLPEPRSVLDREEAQAQEVVRLLRRHRSPID